MSFLHLSLLAGLGAVAVPIMLHLFGQRQPQLIDFPALRFVRETRQEKNTSWQLRHFLLLLLRILLLATMALALARPRVHSFTLDSIFGVSALGLCAFLASLVAAAAYAGRRPMSVWLTSAIVALLLWGAASVWGYRSLNFGPPVPNADLSTPVAAALIVDNGPTMSYRFQNQARLDKAQELALWVLDKLPVESEVGILSGAPVGSLALDPPAAEAQVKLIEPRGATVDLLSRLRTGLDLVLASELERKEIYLITDLTPAAWATAQPALKELLEQYREQILVQIIDVGSEDQSNWSLGDPQPDFESVPAGADVIIEIRVARARDLESKKSVTVELLQEKIDPALPRITNNQLQTSPRTVVDHQVVDLSNSAASAIKLRAHNLEEGSHHFTIRLDSSDPLDIDNNRFLTIVARAQQPTLIVADDTELALNLRFIADPFQEADAGVVEQIRYAQLGEVNWNRFSVLWVHDPPPVTSKTASDIRQFVEGGGHVLLVLGPALGTFDSIRGNPILSLMPGQLAAPTRRDVNDRSAFLTPVALSHALFRDLGDSVNAQLWNPFPVFENWTFESLSDNASKIMQVSDDSSAAVLSESLGLGQIITFTTPIPQVESRDQRLWNELWIADNPIPAFGLLRGALQALYGASQSRVNYDVANPVSLRNDSRDWPLEYQLYLPTARYQAETADDDGILSLGEFEQPGTYYLRALSGNLASRGFSVNVPAAATDLERIDVTLLEDQLGADSFHLASDRSEVESSVGQARFGRELYPLLMVFVAGLFLAEQAMSNRFYKIKFN